MAERVPPPPLYRTRWVERCQLEQKRPYISVFHQIIVYSADKSLSDITRQYPQQLTSQIK